MAGNVDPTPPRPPKAPAKPAARLALTSHTTSAIPVAAPAAVPGTVTVPRRPSTIQSVVPVGADDDKQERRTTSNCSRSRTRRRHRTSHHRHHHRDHYSPRSTPRSQRGRSVETSSFCFSSSRSTARSMGHSSQTGASSLQQLLHLLKQYPLKGTSDLTLKKWLQQFPVETQQEATKFAKMFQDAAVPKAKLQEAAVQYGLPMEQSLKFPPRGLQQLIAIAAALTAWLVISWREWLPLKLFEVFNHLCQFLKYCIHHVPTI